MRDIETPAHIGETLLNTYSKGNPEGSPSILKWYDPVTTDPKGEAHIRMCATRWLLVEKKNGLWSHVLRAVTSKRYSLCTSK